MKIVMILQFRISRKGSLFSLCEKLHAVCKSSALRCLRLQHPVAPKSFVSNDGNLSFDNTDTRDDNSRGSYSCSDILSQIATVFLQPPFAFVCSADALTWWAHFSVRILLQDSILYYFRTRFKTVEYERGTYMMNTAGIRHHVRRTPLRRGENRKWRLILYLYFSYVIPNGVLV